MKKYRFFIGMVEVISGYADNVPEHIINYILEMDDDEYYLQRIVEEDDVVSYYFEELK